MYVIYGDVSGAQDLLLQKKATLWDYDPYGLGLLYVSLPCNQWSFTDVKFSMQRIIVGELWASSKP